METQEIRSLLEKANAELIEAENKVYDLKLGVAMLENNLVQSFKDLPKVERVVAVIEELRLPTELYDGYTDILGLSEEEFKQVVEQLNN